MLRIYVLVSRPTGSIVVWRIILTLALSDCHGVSSVASRVRGAPVDGQLSSPRCNVDLLVVGAWVDEDTLGSRGSRRERADCRLKLKIDSLLAFKFELIDLLQVNLRSRIARTKEFSTRLSLQQEAKSSQPLPTPHPRKEQRTSRVPGQKATGY